MAFNFSLSCCCCCCNENGAIPAPKLKNGRPYTYRYFLMHFGEYSIEERPLVFQDIVFCFCAPPPPLFEEWLLSFESLILSSHWFSSKIDQRAIKHLDCTLRTSLNLESKSLNGISKLLRTDSKILDQSFEEKFIIIFLWIMCAIHLCDGHQHNNNNNNKSTLCQLIFQEWFTGHTFKRAVQPS